MTLTGTQRQLFLSQGYMMFVNCVLISHINKVSEAFLTVNKQNHKLKKTYVYAQRDLSHMLSIGIYIV